jgi:branched-chain amino acid transport system substrate-binding protein
MTRLLDQVLEKVREDHDLRVCFAIGVHVVRRYLSGGVLMKKTRFSALVAASAVFVAISVPANAQIPDRVRMGMLAAVSGSGVAAEASVVTGVKQAVKEINDAGGIGGKPIDLIIGDTQSDPTAAVNEIRRLLGPERIHVLVGPFTSQATLATAPILNQAKVANVSTSGSSELTPKVANYHFSIIPSSDVQVVAMVNYAVDVLKAKSLAWISDNGGQAKTGLEAARVQAKARNVAFLGAQEFPYRATDVTPQMLTLKRLNPDVLLMWPSTGEDHALVVKARDELNWIVHTVNGGGTAVQVPSAVKVYKDAFKDVPSTMLTSWTYCPNDPMGSGDLVKYKERLKVFAGADYTKIAPNYVAWTYDAVYVLKAAIEGAKSVDGPTLTKWIEQNATKIKTVSGSLDASASNHFLFSDPKAIAMVVDTDKPRADGYYKRITGC